MSAIDLASMAHSENQDYYSFVLYFDNDAIVSDSVLPKSGQILYQGFTKTPWILVCCYTLIEVLLDSLGRLTVYFQKLSGGLLCVLNLPH